jgi:Protein of unknown function (DUF2815)
MAQKPNQAITERVRIIFADQLYTPKANDKGVLKYGCALLIPKTDKVTYDRLCAAAEKVKRSAVPGKDEAFYKAHPRTMHDGDGVKPSSGEPYGPECKGNWVLNVSGNERPGIVDAGLSPMVEKIVSGDYIRADLGAFWFETQGNKGVSFGINNVMFLERGERIDGRQDAAEAFAGYAAF